MWPFAQSVFRVSAIPLLLQLQPCELLGKDSPPQPRQNLANYSIIAASSVQVDSEGISLPLGDDCLAGFGLEIRADGRIGNLERKDVGLQYEPDCRRNNTYRRDPRPHPPLGSPD